MALTITISHGSSKTSGNGVRILCDYPTRQSYTRLPARRHVIFPISPRTFHLTFAAKKFSPRTGRFDSKNRRTNTTTKDQDDEQEQQGTAEIEEEGNVVVGFGFDDVSGVSSEVSVDGKPFPELPGLQPDLWEGPQWDVLGFVVQYLWAFGIVFGVKFKSRRVYETKDSQRKSACVRITWLHGGITALFDKRKKVVLVKSKNNYRRGIRE
ncbi:hypothetical protein COLO4_04672 [Corchorus olitorius]|uniref:Uncharacterized protein n=1 Tax=Corchorus olitorius TaxID=93759 RepID=A0A1R3KT49_9ROSI|nr:hypothetical protein COLO4_04672 [Corchorus olitorius]